MNNWNLVFNLMRNISNIFNWIDTWQHLWSISIFMKYIYIYISFALNLECYILKDGLWTLHTHVWKRKANEPGFWTFLPRSYTFSPANVRSRFNGILSFFFCALATSSVPYLILNILLPLNFLSIHMDML